MIYVSRKRGEKGVCWARCWIRDRSCRIQLWEGFWYIRVLMETCDCTEEPWERAEVFCHHVTGREVTPIVPANFGLGVTEHGGATAHDPPRVDSGPHVVQVTECWSGAPGPGYGLLHDEYETRPGGVLQDPGHGLKRRFRMGGSVHPPTTVAYRNPAREWCLSTMGLGGMRGSGHTATTILPELVGRQAIQIAQVDVTAGTYAGFNAPVPGTDPFEFDPAAGFRTIQLPPQSDAATYAAMGPVGGPGLFSELPHLTPFARVATIPAAAVDLGSDLVFELEAFARFCRTYTGSEPFLSRDVCSLRGFPMHPAHDEEGHLPSELHQDEPQAYGPHYLMRDVLQTGEPRNPVRFCRFEYQLDGGGWNVHVPGQLLRGQVLEVRMVLIDETGFWRIASGDVDVRVRFPERMVRLTVPWTPMTPPPGVVLTLPVHPITGGSLFPNQMTAVASAGGAGGTTMHVANVYGMAPGAASVGLMVWSAGGGLPGVADTVDVIVAGW